MVMDRRDFGGSGQEDWFKLHESIDPERGLTLTQANRLADFLRIVGNAARVDSLGGKGRKGVYYRPDKGKQQIRIGTVPRAMLKDWFRERTGTDREPYYEGTVSNFISQNPHLICGHNCSYVHVWREQELGDSMKGGLSRVDVIIETEKDLWIIEVKLTSQPVGAIGSLRDAVNKVKEYGDMVQKLGWWKNKDMNLTVIWGTIDNVPSYSRSFYKSNELPFTEI